MKKSIITIFVTLFIFFSSTVGVFALEPVLETHTPYWLYDLMLQTLNENVSDATWGYVLNNSNNPTMGYYAMVLDANSPAIFEYNVAPGDTVYFRWGVSNFYQRNGTTAVKTIVNGTVVNTTNYTVGSGNYNSAGSVFIKDDYTNTSDYTQTVTFSLRNEMNDFSVTYVPVKVGLQVYFDDHGNSIDSDTDININLEFIENTLIDISGTNSDMKEYLGDIYTEVIDANGKLDYLQSIDGSLTGIYLQNQALLVYSKNIQDTVYEIKDLLTSIDTNTLNTYQKLSEMYDLFANGYDSSNKQELDNTNNTLDSTVNNYSSIESTLFDSLVDPGSMIPTLDNTVIDRLSNSFSILSSVLDTFITIDSNIYFMFIFLLSIGIILYFIGGD